jgi:hypothetical protein
VVEPEENQGKQLSMIPFTNSTWFKLVISLGYLWLHIYIYLSHCWSYFLAFTFLVLYIHILATCS